VHVLGTSGLKVILTEQDVALGGGSLLDARWSAWREGQCARLAGLATVRCLPRTTVLGAYGHGVFGALETLSPPEAARFDGLRERLRIIRARRVVFATRCARAADRLSRQRPAGRHARGCRASVSEALRSRRGPPPVFFLNSDEAYEAVLALSGAGLECAVIDVRESSLAAERVRALGAEVQLGALVVGLTGARGFAPSGSWM